MNVHYVPVVTDVLIDAFRMMNDDELELLFWTKNSVFKKVCSYILISYHYGSKFSNFREAFRVRDDMVVIADSGGFQAITLGVRYNPIDILKWQERNADIAMIFDIPPVDKNLWLLPWDKFVECAKQTAKNAIEMLQAKEKVKLYAVLHGSTRKHIDFWFKQYERYDFDGWAISTKRSEEASMPEAVATAASYLHEVGVKNIHIFALTGFKTFPLIVYLSKYFKEITVDSSSYFIHNDIFYLIFERRLKVGRKMKGSLRPPPCFCPVCRYIETNNLDKWLEESKLSTKRNYIISMHNLFSVFQYVRLLYNLRDSDEFYDFCSPEVVNAINVFERGGRGMEKWLDW
ncbi:MAG: hypothetical protein QXD29_00710 [Thermoplasmata archaeon]